MICEFALEPDLVATWHNRKDFLFFDEKFGLKTGRIISAYPEKWRELVVKAFKGGPYADNQLAEYRLEALIRSISQNIIRRRDSFLEIPLWINKVEAEHNERPFHGIVATDNPNKHRHIISVLELHEIGHECWLVPEKSVVPRHASEIVAAVAPILRSCRQLVFIDPHFSPDLRFLEPMEGFFREIWQNHYGVGEPEVELHTSIDGRISRYTREAEANVCNDFIPKVERKLSRIIPIGKEVKVTIWKQKEHGEKLHNRYLLTEICGVYFGTGLDQCSDQRSSETDDIGLLEPSIYDVRWRQYKGSPPAFDYVHDPIIVSGRLRNR